jgi:hypothetical protein
MSRSWIAVVLLCTVLGWLGTGAPGAQASPRAPAKSWNPLNLRRLILFLALVENLWHTLGHGA